VHIPPWSIEEIDDGIFKCDICDLAKFESVSDSGKSDRKSKINIYVKGHMHAIKKGKDIYFTKYKTDVLYCRPNKPSEKLNLKDPIGFHYDFDKEVSPAHPVFHAQQDNSVLVHDIHDKLNVSLEKSKNRGFGSVRIPTSQLDFYSTILMIIADHLVDHDEGIHVSIFSDLISQCHQKWFKPDSGTESDDYSKHLFMSHNSELCSHNWYCFKK
jgi:hypothetical protein|tara:strand:+ start:18919 stop:19557 length:639 start_codon:yes stop_codon:yes gene_type:complete